MNKNPSVGSSTAIWQRMRCSWNAACTQLPFSQLYRALHSQASPDMVARSDSCISVCFLYVVQLNIMIDAMPSTSCASDSLQEFWRKNAKAVRQSHAAKVNQQRQYQLVIPLHKDSFQTFTQCLSHIYFHAKQGHAKGAKVGRN